MTTQQYDQKLQELVEKGKMADGLKKEALRLQYRALKNARDLHIKKGGK